MIEKIINEASSAITASLEGADDVMTALRTTVRNQVVGIMGDAGDMANKGVEVISSVAAGGIKSAADVGEDIGSVAVNTVKGAIDAAGDVGVETVDATKAAVKGVVMAADEIGSEAGESVRKALRSAAELPRDVVESAIGDRKE